MGDEINFGVLLIVVWNRFHAETLFLITNVMKNGIKVIK